jgi:hypothetical protein
MATTLPELVKNFYGRDPILGEEASQELLKNWRVGAIEALIPLEGGINGGSTQVEVRLKQVAAALGVQIVPHLVRAISTGPWGSKLMAAVCFSGLERSNETERPLIELLKIGNTFDVERPAIEALGYLGSDGWAYRLEEFARSGIWGTGSDQDSERISQYPFEKLSSYVLEAFTRFAARSTDRNNTDSMFRLLTSFIELRQERLPYISPNSYALVARHSHEFTEWGVDPMIDQWGRNSDDKLQRLCTEVLRDVAPLRAAKFLLQMAISPDTSDSVRRGASIALGQIRAPQVAQRLADTLRDQATDRTYLDWAFSTLYAVPADWSGLSEYVDELLTHDNEQANQLRYSLALKGDDRCRKELIEHLDDPDPFNRWTSALALARLLGPESRAYLEHRAEDAGDPMERCAMHAAMIRAGDHDKAKVLHEALQAAVTMPQLYSIWKLEILDAFRIVNTFDARAFSLWRNATQVGTRQLQYFDAISPLSVRSSQSSAPASKPEPPAGRNKVFISYSHKDAKWLNRLQVHLKPLERTGEITRWDDTLIKPGEKWREAIKRGLGEAKVAVLLISADFLASDFIHSNELPPLLSAAESEGVVILQIVLSPCRFEETESLSQFQSVNPSSKPLGMMTKANQEAIFVKVSKIIEDAFKS